MYKTPILLLIFNRPDTTIQVFEAIRKIKPTNLYVAADGPRESREREAELCKRTRDLVLKGIDWECNVKTLFRDENLGCGKAISSAITWFFEQVEEGIILEDDCLPTNSFFTFCQDLLHYYKNDLRIFLISGYNPLGANINSNTYFFSQHISIWGWATWRNRWNKYDFEMKHWGNDEFLEYIKTFMPLSGFDHYKDGFNAVKSKQIDTWDYQWACSVLTQNGLTIKPFANLISNIGITGAHAFKEDKNHFVGYGNLNKSLIHPEIILPSREQDKRFYNWNFPHYKIRKLISRVFFYSQLRKLISKIIG